jgi:hypothetical protein
VEGEIEGLAETEGEIEGLAELEGVIEFWVTVPEVLEKLLPEQPAVIWPSPMRTPVKNIFLILKPFESKSQDETLIRTP